MTMTRVKTFRTGPARIWARGRKAAVPDGSDGVGAREMRAGRGRVARGVRGERARARGRGVKRGEMGERTVWAVRRARGIEDAKATENGIEDGRRSVQVERGPNVARTEIRTDARVDGGSTEGYMYEGPIALRTLHTNLGVELFITAVNPKTLISNNHTLWRSFSDSHSRALLGLV